MSEGKELVSAAYKRYVLGALTLVVTLNSVDRSLIVLFLQPIKEDLHLTDTQLGFLTGIAFGLFYATLGIPIARWADRGNRVTISSAALALWGLTIMSCLWVGNFVQLVFARVAASIGESGCLPPTYSLVGDYFPGTAERRHAMSVYWLASPLAQLISFCLGGVLHQHFGWRRSFFIMGVPALLLATLIQLTVTEPRVLRGQHGSAALRRAGLWQVLRLLWGQHSSRHLSVAMVLAFTLSYGMYPWYAAFLVRSHGMDIGAVGTTLGVIFGFGGITGILLGGYGTSRWLGEDEPKQLRLSGIMIGLLLPCYVAFLLLPGRGPALLALVPLVIVFNFFLGPSFAVLQRLVLDEMRATTLAVILLISNLVGMGVGAQLVGMLSDALTPVFAADSLRYAMLVMSLVAVWAAYHFWQASRATRDDLQRVAAQGSVTVAGAG